MRFEVYRHKSASDEEFDLINILYKRIMSEDRALGIEAQKNLEAGAVDGELPSKAEKEPLYFQAAVRELVNKHQGLEEQAGQEVWPARQTLPDSAATSQEDVDFCSKLTSQSQAKADCSSQAGGCCGGMACSTGNETLAY